MDSYQQFIAWLNKTEEVYFYGAGKICNDFFCVFEMLGLWEKVKAIFVSKCENKNELYHGKPVIEFSKEKVEDNVPIIITVMEHHQKEIKATLEGQGVVNYVWMSNKELDNVLGHFGIDGIIKKIITYAEKNRKEVKEDILFLSPPYWDVYSPFSAVPCLVAKLMKEGYKTKQIDLGIHCIRQVIESKHEYLTKRCLSREFYTSNFSKYDKNSYNSFEEYKEDMWFFKGEKFDIEQVKKAYETMNPVQKRVIDAFYNIAYAWELTSIDFDKCEDLESAIYTNNVRSFLGHLLHPELIKIFAEIPEIVGISITSTCQFLPGYVLAKIIKMCKPNTTIILGGSCADLFAKSAYKNKNDINKYFDYIIIGEGETALSELMGYLKSEKQGDLKSIPNLILIDESNQIHYTEQIIENVKELPLANYDDLDLNLYLAPRIILPYQSSRGCHYGQCAFCNHDEKYRHNYRSKDMKVVVKELLELSQKYGVLDFQFVDEAIRPDCFVEMVEEMDKHREFLNIKWFYYSRVSRVYTEEILRKAKKNGCSMVMFGIESLNQRLLKHIKKGINAETSKYCLKLFHECGIKTYAWLLCNLPSETLEEAKEDMEAVMALEENIDAFSVNPFYLYRNTDMYSNPEQYNIVSFDEKDERRFQSHNAGIIIDKDAMLDFYQSEYFAYQVRRFSKGNRYTVFFEH